MTTPRGPTPDDQPLIESVLRRCVKLFDLGIPFTAGQVPEALLKGWGSRLRPAWKAVRGQRGQRQLVLLRYVMDRPAGGYVLRTGTANGKQRWQVDSIPAGSDVSS